MGGNLGTASPAGDALPPLAVLDAEVEVASAARGSRRVPFDAFFLGPKRTALAPDELIVAVAWPDRGVVGSFSKVGVRNAMVIAVASLCLALDRERRTVRVALGSVGPTVVAYVPGVDQSFGGLFKPSSPPPGRTQPPCTKLTTPWQGKSKVVTNGKITNQVLK